MDHIFLHLLVLWNGSRGSQSDSDIGTSKLSDFEFDIEKSHLMTPSENPYKMKLKNRFPRLSPHLVWIFVIQNTRIAIIHLDTDYIFSLNVDSE